MVYPSTTPAKYLRYIGKSYTNSREARPRPDPEARPEAYNYRTFRPSQAMRKLSLFCWSISLLHNWLFSWAQIDIHNTTTTNGDLKDLYVLGMFPMRGQWAEGPGYSQAVLMGLEDVNARQDLLPGYRLNMIWNDTQVSRLQLQEIKQEIIITWRKRPLKWYRHARRFLVMSGRNGGGGRNAKGWWQIRSNRSQTNSRGDAPPAPRDRCPWI